MFFQVAAISDLGCVREKNEDNFICNQYVKDMEEGYCFVNKKLENSDIRPVIYGVFDGMGGYSKGEVSSYAVAMNAKKAVKKADIQNIAREIDIFYKKSNEEICEYMSKYNVRTGTTAALMCIYKDRCVFSNVGDSSIFRLRKGTLVEMYEEHTERKLYERLHADIPGKKKFRLTQYLGVYPEELMIEPYIKIDKLEKDDVYIVCSDGLTDMVSMERIMEVLEQEEKPENVVKKLVHDAKMAGGKDNITIICLKI